MSATREQLLARYGSLLSIYGPLLSEDGRQLMQLYYDEDLSLAEIAQTRDLSRQAVSGALQRQRRLLDRYESVLKLSEREAWMHKHISLLKSHLQMGQTTKALSLLDDIGRQLGEN
ncbi:MAG TPA: hypothetical protein GXZ64_04890 [Clostridiaceae bacterium]|nr:hypothetical protein [Clostridiaceae bacterium]